MLLSRGQSCFVRWRHHDTALCGTARQGRSKKIRNLGCRSPVGDFRISDVDLASTAQVSYFFRTPLPYGAACVRCPHVMAGFGLSDQNSAQAIARRGQVRSPYDVLCLFYAKYPRCFRNTPGRLSYKIKSFTLNVFLRPSQAGCGVRI